MSLVLVARKNEPAAERPKPRISGSRLRVSEPHDAFEQEADRVAGEVMRGARLSRSSLSRISSPGIQRQSATSPSDQTSASPQQTKPSDALGKLAEAFLRTDLGKKLTEAIKNDELVKGALDFVGTLPGKVIAGAAATGAVAGLAAAHQPLPAQLPELPLDVLKPGLRVKLNFQGPVDHPTQATITFSYTPQGEKKKPTETASEGYRAETARIAADQEKFRAGMRYKPGSPEDLQQKGEQKAVEDYVNSRFGALPGLGRPLGPQNAGPATPDTGLRFPALPNPYQPKAPTLLLDKQLELKPLSSEPQAKKKEEPAPVQRKAAGNSASGASLSGDALPRSSGHPLDQHTRAFMESRFGYDFSKVRVHTGSEAAESARHVSALAYTVGNHLVFSDGQYSPNTAEGRKLLAHELAHTIQQGHSTPARESAAFVPSTHAAPTRTLQRKCACGGSDAASACEECKSADLLQRQAASPEAHGPKSDFSGCDEKMQSDLHDKQGPAVERVSGAITALSKGWRQMDPATKAVFNKFFDPAGTGDVDDSFVSDVRRNFQKIRSYMSSLSFDCDVESKTICGSGKGWCVGTRVMWTCFGALHVCPDAYNKADEGRKIGAIIHESVHNALHTTDREYASSKDFSRLKPRGSGFLSFLSKIPIIGAIFRLFRSNNDTLNNPDSYSHFAMEI